MDKHLIYHDNTLQDHGSCSLLSNCPEKPFRPKRVRSGAPLPFQITKRDIEIVRFVAKYRFLNSDHIRRLVQGSAKNITNRLKLLFEHELLDRPECQYGYYRPGGGSEHIVYGVSDKGTKLLADNDAQTSSKRSSWAHKNRSVGHPHLKHTLAISDFAVSLRLSVRHHNDVDLADGDRLLSSFPTETRALNKPYRLNTSVTHQGMHTAVGVEPDYAFSLYLTELKCRAFFLVEIDRGTMPIERSNLRQTSILRKLLAYQSIWQSKQHQQHFGWRNFRVLFVTTSAERVENMITSMNKHAHTRQSPIFLFTDKQSLYTGDMLAYEWQDGAGVTHRLIPNSR